MKTSNNVAQWGVTGIIEVHGDLEMYVIEILLGSTATRRKAVEAEHYKRLIREGADLLNSPM